MVIMFYVISFHTFKIWHISTPLELDPGECSANLPITLQPLMQSGPAQGLQKMGFSAVPLLRRQILVGELGKGMEIGRHSQHNAGVLFPFYTDTSQKAGDGEETLDTSQSLLVPGNWEDIPELSLLPVQFSSKALKFLNKAFRLISVLEVELVSISLSLCKRK